MPVRWTWVFVLDVNLWVCISSNMAVALLCNCGVYVLGRSYFGFRLGDQYTQEFVVNGDTT